MYQINVSLSENQIRKAKKGKTNLRLKHANLVGPHPLQVGKREFNKWNKARENGKGVVIQTAEQAGGSLLGLAAAAAPMAAKALGLAGLSFGAEKLLKTIFGSGIPPGAIQLAKLVEMPAPAQKKLIRNMLKGQGIVSGGGQRGGFLGLLASLGIPLAISLVKKSFGEGSEATGSGRDHKAKRKRNANSTTSSSLGKMGKKKFVDIALSNFDLWDWCDQLGIPLKGIFARNEKMGKNHSPCIINLDDMEGIGTHWVCCWFSGKHFEYFDSFGLPPPLEWENNLRKWFPGMKTFLRNNFQIQDVSSLRCGYYCLCFLNEKNKGKKYSEILSMFTQNPKENEKIIKDYFVLK